MKQWALNISNINKVTKRWFQNFCANQQESLKKIEVDIASLYNSNKIGFLSEADFESSKSLEIKRHDLLFKEQQLWRLKIWEIWIKAGDNSTKFFHRFASHRRN